MLNACAKNNRKENAMIHQSNFGIEEYVNELDIESSDNVGRIIQKNNHLYTIATINRIIPKVKSAYNEGFFVGDFVLFNCQDDDCHLKQLLDRKNVISKASSHAAKSYHVRSYEQTIAANVDQLYILIAADQRFTLSKLERYLMTFNQETIEMNILISKADYMDGTKEITDMIHATYPGLKITPISTYQQDMIQDVKDSLSSRNTAMFIGASGVGKSTLINHLIGNQIEETNVVRNDGKGKHTTTVTKMVYVADTDSFLIDSPGFKTISTTKEMDGKILFEEIQELGRYCKFN